MSKEKYMHSETADLVYDNKGRKRPLDEIVDDIDDSIDPSLYRDLEGEYGETPIENSDIELKDVDSHLNVDDGDGCVEVWEHLSEGRDSN